MSLRIVTAFGAAALAATVWFGIGAEAQQPDGFALAVDDKGKLRVPDVDYRKSWSLLGVFVVNGDDAAEGMHAVYTQPESVEVYRETGSFPDGTVLVKELFGTETEDMTTGSVSRAAETQGWFVMVKDATGRYAGNPLWGDGWGWAYFDGDDPKTSPTESYVAECKECHVPAQNTDWIYVQGYPVLKKN